MIYTLTFNPSLDYIVTVPKFTCGVVNRTTEEIIFPGGKGINVSMVLKNLGFENTALGFYAGFTGMELKRLVADKGIHAEFILPTCRQILTDGSVSLLGGAAHSCKTSHTICSSSNRHAHPRHWCPHRPARWQGRQ